MKTESLYISNNALGKVNVYKYIGVDLDENLTMNNMIDSTFNKANCKVYLLKKIRPYITREIANRIYKTCILPILDYADFLVDSGWVSFIGKLDTIQKRFLKDNAPKLLLPPGGPNFQMPIKLLECY